MSGETLALLRQAVVEASGDERRRGWQTLEHAEQLELPVQGSPQKTWQRLGIASRWQQRPQLLNVHWGIPAVGLSRVAGRVHLVRGHYAFFYYGCDGFADSGWGCAYRSIQTICAFVYLNHPTLLPASHPHLPSAVPSHRDIQAALVSLRDKEPHFVGTREWIGSFEAMLVLQSWYGISCKILHCPTGSFALTHAPALRDHFDLVGSPVMIGGRCKAFTLLGIDFNPADPSTTLLLILDPHFTGPPKPPSLLKNGCSWIPASKFFLPDSFYNLCLPLLPSLPHPASS